jgi:Mn-dependent DtxR family transcriptional regulator
MTPALIADMLGVDAKGVAAATGRLHDAGLIRHSEGDITVLERPGLEALVCECYSVVRRETDRLFPAAAA